MVTLLSRHGCHLCEEAHAELKRLATEIRFELSVVSVDSDPELAESYGDLVPVVLVNGEENSVYRVNRKRLVGAVRSVSG